MTTKENAVDIKGIIEDVYKKYGCNDVEVSAVYQNSMGDVSRLTESRDIKPAKVSVNNNGTAIILINSEEPYLGKRFFKILDEIKKCLRENDYSITKAGCLYDCYMVELTYES